MKNTIIKLLFYFFVSSSFIQLQAQVVLTKQEAIAQTLQNNFGIQVSNNVVLIAENNASLLNSGYLPSLTGIAGADYSKQDQEATFQDGTASKVFGAETDRYNASLNLNYTLFDGLGRYYNYKSIKEQYQLSELQARETIEVTILQLFSVYYEVARLSENVSVLQETLLNTKKRLTRAEYQFEYGQNTRLEVLNAKVDITADSINLMQIKQQLINAKRDLNVVMNLDLESKFHVDTLVTFINDLSIENFILEAETKNIRLLQAEQNIKISDFDRKASKSIYLPSLGLQGSYGWNKGNFPSTNFLSTNTSVGFSTGLNLTWNLFDGGSGITNVKNTKIQLTNRELLKQELQIQVQRDIANANGNYKNRIAIYKLQQQNVETSSDNYLRSFERYKLGQITSLELRQAQINLLNAKTNKNLAKYEAKLAELELLQLTGNLLSVVF
ncbi:MAG: transporter [Bacteroidetes bacterium HGW-Bacteroidetes-2]|jgi:outer membrane protein TolC|nr:MAG: transporter [Bacteroidetes bacterium HGW-Bacteroidetes-2]